MKIYTDKNDRYFKGPKILQALVGLLMIIIPIVVLIKGYYRSGSIKESIVDSGILISFLLFFICFGVFYIYLSLRKPFLCSCKLISLNKEVAEDKTITYMAFEVCTKEGIIHSLTNNMIMCFTYDNVNLEINEYYDLLIGSSLEVKDIKGKSTENKYYFHDFFYSGMNWVVRIPIFSFFLVSIYCYKYDYTSRFIYLGAIILYIIVFIIIIIKKFLKKDKSNEIGTNNS